MSSAESGQLLIPGLDRALSVGGGGRLTISAMLALPVSAAAGPGSRFVVTWSG